MLLKEGTQKRLLARRENQSPTCARRVLQKNARGLQLQLTLRLREWKDRATNRGELHDGSASSSGVQTCSLLGVIQLGDVTEAKHVHSLECKCAKLQRKARWRRKFKFLQIYLPGLLAGWKDFLQTPLGVDDLDLAPTEQRLRKSSIFAVASIYSVSTADCELSQKFHRKKKSR